jgi:dihydrolipoamide dehydrogenase
LNVPKHDIAIIGGGPGGYVAAIRAAQLGKRVALIERERVGGLCLNWGCIPSKALLWNAEVVELVRDAGTYGITFDNLQLDMGAAIDRSRAIVDQMVKGVEFLLNKHNVTVISGAASFEAPGRLRVAGSEDKVEADHVIIATGARPRVLPGLETDGAAIMNSTDALSLRKQPASVVIVGGGPIGVEFATFWRAYGVDVTIVEAMPRLLPSEDEDVSTQLERAFKKRGIKVHTSVEDCTAKASDNGASVDFTVKGRQHAIAAEKVLVGIGFEANVEGLGLDGIGAQVERGYVKVDENLLAASGVYAIGDVTGIMNMAHVASAMGVMVVERIAGHDSPALNYHHMPRATYCHPEVAGIGLTEKQARDQGFDVKAGKFPVRANGRAKAMNMLDGMVKVIADAKTGETLGIHMVGPMVTELLGEASLGMTLETTPRELGWTVAAHPTLAECVKEAALAVNGEAIHFISE